MYLLSQQLITVYFIIYFWLCWVFNAVHGLSLVAMSGGLLFIAMVGLLTAVDSLLEKHGL